LGPLSVPIIGTRIWFCFVLLYLGLNGNDGNGEVTQNDGQVHMYRQDHRVQTRRSCADEEESILPPNEFITTLLEKNLTCIVARSGPFNQCPRWKSSGHFKRDLALQNNIYLSNVRGVLRSSYEVAEIFGDFRLTSQ
jgi:hypothetical protein